MSRRIRQLNPHVVNRIAAGEVIERPASVVKELLENSVDALATRIEVDISAGGLELIRITDNGEGMHPDDLELAVTSHATSKISSDSDLDQVATLGFRGEALASIASVSRFHIRTRRSGSPTGSELRTEGGDTTTLHECGCQEGTRIEVHNLFYNTPARRRFLRKPSTEFGRISEQFSRIALANPRLHMVLRHNNRLVYELPGSASQEDRIRRFFGSDIADKLIAVESKTTDGDGQTTRLWGFVGDPSLSKSTRKNQFLFLNGRWIQDRSLQHALGEAYRGLLMVGRNPVSFLFLEVPPHLVDVNVHPTKTEVRFQDGQALYRQLLRTIRDRFLKLDFDVDIRIPAKAAGGTSELAHAGTAVQKELNVWADSATRPSQRSPTSLPERVIEEFRPFPEDQVSGTGKGDRSAAVSHPDGTESDPGAVGIPNAPHAPLADTSAAAEHLVPLDEFRAIQVHDCYLVVATDDGIEIIDQHALHERILYEHLRIRVLEGSVERQKLLIPETVECTAVEASVLCEYEDLLRDIGFEVQEFGGTTVLLESHPVLIPRGNFVRILKDFAEQLENSDGRTSRRDLLDRMLHTMACRAAIKAGKRLTQEEMYELLNQRHQVADSHHCPHGRPTSMKLPQKMLDRQFGRLG
ncbi:MAG: DNA mismatch repair endonuclease MutL [Fuerstiella sp.]|nr:DNA mismatch repair endonuclease MutL [Fuerstiella sp.]